MSDYNNRKIQSNIFGGRFSRIVFQCRSEADIVCLTASFAQLMNVNNRPTWHDYTVFEWGLNGFSGSGKTEISDVVLGTDPSFEVVDRGVFEQFIGDSKLFGKVRRRDIQALRLMPDNDLIKQDWLSSTTAWMYPHGLDITEHGLLTDTKFHILTDVGGLQPNGAREFTFYVSKPVAVMPAYKQLKRDASPLIRRFA